MPLMSELGTPKDSPPMASLLADLVEVRRELYFKHEKWHSQLTLLDDVRKTDRITFDDELSLLMVENHQRLTLPSGYVGLYRGKYWTYEEMDSVSKHSGLRVRHARPSCRPSMAFCVIPA